MDLEISTSKPTTIHNEYGAPSMMPSTMPTPSILLKKENEPWRGPSAFGMANILNHNHNTASAAPLPPPLPKFNLPSLHSFGKPLITKQEPSMNRVRSILNDSPMSPPAPPAPSQVPQAAAVEAATAVDATDSDRNVTSSSDSSPFHTSQSPPHEDMSDSPHMSQSAAAAAPSRRIAPAPTDDDDCGGGDDDNGGGSDSIRGGRWSSEEHDRFLAGFRIHGHKWKRVQQVVRTRSVTQVRTHAQKYLLKLAKLKADKKSSSAAGSDGGHGADNGSDTESTHARMSSSTPPEYNVGGDTKSPSRKKMRRYDTTTTTGTNAQPVDEAYIAAAAATLLFLMRQKIDSLFDSRMEDEKDLEPFDCYSNSEQAYGSDDHSIENSRKRPFMHLITDNSTEYSYSEQPSATVPEGSGYSIDGKQLCS